ncbi:MAG: MBL fold metallo-hydrolase [Treponema sp.]|nr:MBL fold metallo-hydrolase [Treponema sp.]
MKIKFLVSLLFFVLAVNVFSSQSDGICSVNIGQFEISMLVERENPGNPAILAGADDAIIKQYLPSGGYTQSTNTFLIKAPGMNILVDTGFGQAVFDKMKILGVSPDQIDAVLLTHLHPDHIGGLQKDGQAIFTKAKIYVSNRELEYFTKTQVNRAAVAALEPYGARVISFEPAQLGSVLNELLPGIFPIALYGHTPGHTGYLLQSGGAQFIIGGDFLHVAAVQFAHPEISTTYDMDRTAAAQSRQTLLEYAAKNKIPVGGMHIVYPGFGMVETAGDGFSFVP